MTDHGTPENPPTGVTLPASNTPDAYENYSPKIFLRQKVADGDDDRRNELRRTYYVGVHIETQIEERFGLTGNISSGGLFVVAENPPPLGSEIALDFLLSDDTASLIVEGVVRWVRQDWDDEGKRPPGFGVEFDEFPPAQRQLLADLLDELDAPSSAVENSLEDPVKDPVEDS
jgi:uncharacterized protein (TIGR02266 family)